MKTIYTIGHSTRPIEEFIALLRACSIEVLVDVRTVPRSRHNPQFEADALRSSLSEAGIVYIHMTGLGGLRRARHVSSRPDVFWQPHGVMGVVSSLSSSSHDPPGV